MKRERKITVRYLRTERFTNKNVDIKVQLYEMDRSEEHTSELQSHA